MEVILYDTRESICCQMTRLVLAEKGVTYRKHPIDISGERNEQFEPWYLVINPKAVVPTLQVGAGVIRDTLVITPLIDELFDGPTLLPDDGGETREWMAKVMALHYGVLLYKDLVDENGECSTVQERHRHLSQIRERDGDPTGVLTHRIESNERFQAVLADPERTEELVAEAHRLVEQMDAQLADQPFLVGASYTIADAFATAALARFEAHGLQGWWDDGRAPNVARYYVQMRARPSFDEAEVQREMEYHG